MPVLRPWVTPAACAASGFSGGGHVQGSMPVLLNQRSPCLEPLPKSVLLLWPKAPRLDVQFPQGGCSSAALAHIRVPLLYLPVELCAGDAALTLLLHGVRAAFFTCHNRSAHQLSAGNCPPAQRASNGVSYHKPFCYRLKETNFFCLCCRVPSEAGPAMLAQPK